MCGIFSILINDNLYSPKELYQSFYKGNGYLIEAFFENLTIYFENVEEIMPRNHVFLAWNK